MAYPSYSMKFFGEVLCCMPYIQRMDDTAVLVPPPLGICSEKNKHEKKERNIHSNLITQVNNSFLRIKAAICTCASVTISLMLSSLIRLSKVFINATFSMATLLRSVYLLSTVRTLMMSMVSCSIAVYVQYCAQWP